MANWLPRPPMTGPPTIVGATSGDNNFTDDAHTTVIPHEQVEVFVGSFFTGPPTLILERNARRLGATITIVQQTQVVFDPVAIFLGDNPPQFNGQVPYFNGAGLAFQLVNNNDYWEAPLVKNAGGNEHVYNGRIWAMAIGGEGGGNPFTLYVTEIIVGTVT